MKKKVEIYGKKHKQTNKNKQLCLPEIYCKKKKKKLAIGYFRFYKLK